MPRPQALVHPGWQLQDRQRIAAYLRSGQISGTWCGHAYCRFTECGQTLGSCDLTDGTWYWPQGLEHYVLAHEVCLPDTFVETMRTNDWQVPAAVNAAAIQLLLEKANAQPFGDVSYWVLWANEFAAQRPLDDQEKRSTGSHAAGT